MIRMAEIKNFTCRVMNIIRVMTDLEYITHDAGLV